MTLLAGFQALLHRYTGQEDIAVGTPIAGRARPEFAAMIGLFVNTLVLRTDLAGGPDFRELLGRVRRTAMEAYAHQDAPFEQLVAAVQPGRDAGQSPLFRVMFVYQEDPLRELRMPGLSIVPLEIDSVAAKFDLTLFASETDQGLRLKLEYDADLFDAATIDRMLGHYRILLEGALADPSRPVAALPMLAESERRQLLREWNATRAEYPREVPVHRLFEAQVARTPEAVALAFNDRTLSYRELDARANRLAHHLRGLGVGPETRVGLCFERSPEMVIGLLAVLKAGGAYVPLDPAYPAERLAYMLADSGAEVLLTRQALRDRLPDHSAQVVCLDADEGAIAARPETAPEGGAGPDHLAYIIYTSGSTGRPKGAMIVHRGLTNYLSWCTRAYAADAGRGAPVQSSISFDLTVTSLFAPLLCGGRVDLLPEEQGVEALAEALRRGGDYSLVKITPAHLQLLGQQLAPHEAAGRTRAFVVGGEQLTDEHLAFWRENAPETLVINEYGPTETVVGCCVYRVPRGEPSPGAVPIGRPIANTRLYVLDARLEPAPVGVPGELYIGGDGVARGYLGRPGLTAERFVPDPFGPPGGRLYRTGDRARWRRGGELEYLGRTDDQVKVRGYRVELGEVEAAVARHPGVREAAVVAREDSPGDRRLIAYVVSETGGAVDVDELRRDLARSLPEYMVPAAIVSLEAMPLTANGKVDRRALPTPPRVEAVSAPDTPGHPIEEKLVRVVAGILNRHSVGIGENLFDLGIDSILVIQIVSRARQAGLRLNPGQVFRHQTIADLARVAEQVETVEAEQGPVVGPVPLTPIQRWFFEQDLPAPHHFNQSLLLEMSPTPDPEQLRRALDSLIRHHDALRLRFTRTEGGWSQHADVPDECDLPFEHVDLSALPESDRIPVLEAESARFQASLDLERGPLLRVALFDLGPDRPARLLLVLHHLVVDGVSWRILLEDLATALAQLERGEEPVLPPKTTSFRQWAELLTRHAGSAALESERGYWLADGREAVAPLPVDLGKGRDPGTVAESAVVSAALDEEETRALLQEVPRAFHSQINDALLAALAGTLAGWTGRRRRPPRPRGPRSRGDRRRGGPVADGRLVHDHLPRPPGPARRPRPGRGLASGQGAIAAHPRRGIGYGLLRYLSDDPDIAGRLRSAPGAEVAFNYLGQLDQALPASSGLAPARESAGPARAPEGRRPHLLDLLGFVVGGRLRFDWTYNPGVHRRETIEGLADAFLGELRALVELARSPEVRGYTPSDFPLAGLDQATLDHIFSGERGIEDIYPLSPTQEGMLFHSAYAPESGVYVQQWTCTLRGDLDPSAFQAAWRQVVDRHPALRTSFHWVDSDRPVQVVHRQVDPPLEEFDWSGEPPDVRAGRFAEFLSADRERGFVASWAPLLRLALIRTEDRVVQLVLTYHHMILDGWCMPIVFAEALGLYEAGRAGREVSLPARRPYRDYIAWLQGRDLSESEAYWRETLRGFRSPTPLGIERSGANALDEPAPRGERFARLSSEATAALQVLSRAHQVTMNTLVQGAWALVLGRYSGQGDVVFGVTVSGRPPDLEGAEAMVGLFINTLPARVSVVEESPLLPWLKEIQARQIEMREHEQSPLVLVQGWSEVPRGRPLFESLVVFENYPVDASLDGAGWGPRHRGGPHPGADQLPADPHGGSGRRADAEGRLRRRPLRRGRHRPAAGAPAERAGGDRRRSVTSARRPVDAGGR